MIIKLLSRTEISAVYETHMKKDFPASELKPLSSIERMMDMGCYLCTGLFDGETLVAYGFFVMGKECGCVLLDYLAVCSNYRSKGLGGIYMEQMRRFFSDVDGLLIECESEYSAKPEELSIRSRRIRFYEKCGAVLTSAKSWLFGVDYSILYFPIQKTCEETDVHEALERIYNTMFQKKHSHLVRRWRRQRVLHQVSVIKDDTETFCGNLCTALGIDMDRPPEVISLVGGGGKTSTMFELADELAEHGKKVIVTTSTHIMEPDETTLQSNIEVAGNPGSDYRLTPPDSFTELMKRADVLLIEADGAKTLPFKVPEEYEPVIIPETEWVIACVGMDAVGESFEHACFRTELACKRLGKTKTDVITPADAAAVLTSEWGSKKGVENRIYRVVLNKTDTPERKAAARDVSKELKEYGLSECVLSSYVV